MDSTDNASKPQRRYPVHLPLIEAENRSTIIFLTVCTKGRRPALATHIAHEALRRTWIKSDHWLVGRYVIMPDHLHLFCAPHALPIKPLANWIRYWKALVSRSALAPEGTFWQPGSWDTQLRRHESYSTKWEYVRNNPVRAGFVADPNEWPFQGELNVLRWHD
ncbi:MAG TPA: transposase [Lacunisphaera sp.]|jgi:putative transposase|nr:transposase [Lacunisphaera sp.]